jgi:hypothetical protein
MVDPEVAVNALPSPPELSEAKTVPENLKLAVGSYP